MRISLSRLTPAALLLGLATACERPARPAGGPDASEVRTDSVELPAEQGSGPVPSTPHRPSDPTSPAAREEGAADARDVGSEPVPVRQEAPAPEPAPAQRKASALGSGGVPTAARPAPPPLALRSRGAVALESSVVAPCAGCVPPPIVRPQPGSGEDYEAAPESPFLKTTEHPLSTFSIDVDTASYSNLRRFLHRGERPPQESIRVEEMINYFSYDYPDPEGAEPFSVNWEVSAAPWNPQHRLLQVGLQGKRLAVEDLPPRNLVFLLDVSGSMSDPEKLPLLKRSLATLAETLREQDRVAIAVYAGASGLVLPPTPGSERATILAALDRLEAGGSTNGGAGIELAYGVAQKLARPGSSTRVILATDGDFNVGVTDRQDLLRLIERKREAGVFLSVLGLGMGNLKDATLEQLADRGNGNYAYVDSLSEARKVLVKEGGATLTTLAKDVKLQLEFNPAYVASYRLIGYDNRRLAARDFNDDTKDAGELGAGHSVTALYELIPPGAEISGPGIDPLKYQSVPRPDPRDLRHPGELGTLKLRYKRPDAARSQLIERVLGDSHTPLARTSDDFRFAAAVAAFGLTLTDSSEKGTASLDLARELALHARGADREGYRREFLDLVDRALTLPAASSGVARRDDRR